MTVRSSTKASASLSSCCSRRRSSTGRAMPATAAGRGPWESRSGYLRRQRAERRSGVDAPWLGVDVQPPVAREAAERKSAVTPELDGEARGRADGDHDRAAGDRRLLDELEREAPAHA